MAMALGLLSRNVRDREIYLSRACHVKRLCGVDRLVLVEGIEAHQVEAHQQRRERGREPSPKSGKVAPDSGPPVLDGAARSPRGTRIDVVRRLT